MTTLASTTSANFGVSLPPPPPPPPLATVSCGNSESGVIVQDENTMARKDSSQQQNQFRKKPIVRITIGDDNCAANVAAASRFRKKVANNSSSGMTPPIMKPPLAPLPPPPPPPTSRLDERQSSSAEHHNQKPLQQVATSEDLSFADFSALEDSFTSQSDHHVHNGYHYQQSQSYYQSDRHNNNPSLSGFLEDESAPHKYGATSASAAAASSLNSPPQHASSRKSHYHYSRKVNAVDVASVGNASDTIVVQPSSSSQTSSNGGKSNSNNNTNVTSTTNNLATRDLHEKAKLAFNAADYSSALPLFESILTAQVRRFSPLHPSVGAAMHNVGVCRQRLGQHALAEKLFTEAVQIREQCLGRDHLEVAASLSKLGAAQTALGKYDEAFEKLRKAVKIAIDTLGRPHKTVAQMLCHLACLYFEAGELMSSEATFCDALDIYRDVWSQTSSLQDRDACMTQLTDTLCNVGSIQNRRKRFGAACESFSEALDLQRGIVSHTGGNNGGGGNSSNEGNDARIISTLDNLGYSYSKLKNYTAALHCYRQMYRAQTQVSVTSSQSLPPPTFSLACFETLRKQILMLEKLRRFAEAIDETNAALSLMSSSLPPPRNDTTLLQQTKDLRDELVQKQSRAEHEC